MEEMKETKKEKTKPKRRIILFELFERQTRQKEEEKLLKSFISFT